MLDPDNPKTNQ